MRMGWLVTLVLVAAAIIPPIAVGQARAQEKQEKQEEKTENCLLPKGWDPAEDLRRILAEHREWVAKWKENRPSEEWIEAPPEGRANLCNANLHGVDLDGVNLREARLSGADLREAHLDDANLSGAKLNGVDLGMAKLNNADLTGADLSGAGLLLAKLEGADLRGADLSGADLRVAKLNYTDLRGASVKDTHLAFAKLEGSIYAPSSLPPDSYLEEISGLSTAHFDQGRNTGLVQLRELLQKAGLRNLEREATFAIERGRTWHAICKQPIRPRDVRLSLRLSVLEPV